MPCPRVNQNKRAAYAVHVRVDDETEARLKAMAKAQNTTVAETVRTLIEWGFESC